MRSHLGRLVSILVTLTLGITAAAHAAPHEVKIQLRYLPEEVQVDLRPVLGIFGASTFQVKELVDMRLLDDRGVIGECASRSGPIAVWTDVPVSEFVADTTRDLLRGWGLSIRGGRADYVLGVQLVHFYVHEDDIYDAEVELRLRLETPGGQLLWKGAVKGTATREGRSQREALYNAALGEALARAVAKFLGDTSVRAALTRPAEAVAAAPRDVRPSVAAVTDPRRVPASETPAVVPAVPGTIVVLHRRDGVPLVTQLGAAPGAAAAATTQTGPDPGPEPAKIAAPTPFAEQLPPDAFARPSTLAPAARPRPVSDAVLAGERGAPGTGLAPPEEPPAEPPKPVAAPAPNVLTPALLLTELVRLTEAGAGEDLLLAYVDRRTVTGEMTADDLVAFKKAGLSDVVVRKVLEKAK